MRRWLLDVLHNCVAHPLLPFLPRRWGDALHDATARWMCDPDPERAPIVTITVVPIDPADVRSGANRTANDERWGRA